MNSQLFRDYFQKKSWKYKCTRTCKIWQYFNDTDVHMGGGLYSKIKLVYYLRKEIHSGPF